MQQNTPSQRNSSSQRDLRNLQGSRVGCIGARCSDCQHLPEPVWHRQEGRHEAALQPCRRAAAAIQQACVPVRYRPLLKHAHEGKAGADWDQGHSRARSLHGGGAPGRGHSRAGGGCGRLDGAPGAGVHDGVGVAHGHGGDGPGAPRRLHLRRDGRSPLRCRQRRGHLRASHAATSPTGPAQVRPRHAGCFHGREDSASTGIDSGTTSGLSCKKHHNFRDSGISKQQCLGGSQHFQSSGLAASTAASLSN